MKADLQQKNITVDFPIIELFCVSVNKPVDVIVKIVNSIQRVCVGKSVFNVGRVTLWPSIRQVLYF